MGPILRATESTIEARSASLPGRGYVGLSIHDLDGDGANELIAIQETIITSDYAHYPAGARTLQIKGQSRSEERRVGKQY